MIPVCTQIVDLCANQQKGMRFANVIINGLLVNNEKTCILLDNDGNVGNHVQIMVMDPISNIDTIISNPAFELLEPTRISPYSIVLNGVLKNPQLQLAVVLTWTDGLSINEFAFTCGDFMMFRCDRFVYAYDAIMATKTVLHEELIREIYKPERLIKWMDAGHDPWNYLE